MLVMSKTLDKINEVCYTVLMVDVAQLAEQRKIRTAIFTCRGRQLFVNAFKPSVAGSSPAVYHCGPNGFG